MGTGEWAKGFLYGIQYGFERETISYMEQKKCYADQPILYYQFKTNSTGNPIHVVADACIDFIFCCDGPRSSAEICGTVLAGKKIVLRPGKVYFGVRLPPRLSLLMPGLPFKEVVDGQASFNDLLNHYTPIIDKISACKGFKVRIACIEQVCMPIVRGNLKSPELVDYCLTVMDRCGGAITIRNLAERTGYSERYVRTKFEQKLGIAPKQYNRIIRFQRALERITRTQASLTEVVNEIGYFDQAHLMKDFKAFSLLSPNQLRLQVSVNT